MHEFWTISTANMTYTRLQNYTNMVVGKHRIPNSWSCGCLVFLSPQVHILYYLWTSGLTKNTSMSINYIISFTIGRMQWLVWNKFSQSNLPQLIGFLQPPSTRLCYKNLMASTMKHNIPPKEKPWNHPPTQPTWHKSPTIISPFTCRIH